MNFSLKNHPFAVSAHFDHSLVLTFATPVENLASLVPPCLRADNHGPWGFVALALVQTRKLRPAGFPSFMGNDFFLAGYRVFVRYTTSYGKTLRGLYILRSETDRRRMEFLGNMFTHYKYSTTDIICREEGSVMHVHSSKSGIDIKADISGTAPALPEGSPFQNWKEARRFAGPLPFTFTYQEQKKQVLIIEGVRENWTPEPVSIIHSKVELIDSLGLPGTRLANAFIIRDIPYTWKKGRTDLWKY